MNYQEQYQYDRKVLRLLVRSRTNFQSIRIAVDNRLGRKKDKTDQNIESRWESAEDKAMFIDISNAAKRQEEAVAKNLLAVLKRFPIYNEWLSKIKGIKEIGAAWLIGEFDIYRAENRSKMWQFAGFNPDMVRGRKSIKKSKYISSMGEYVKDLPDSKNGEKRIEIRTWDMVKGDKPTPDFLLPYNGKLKVALIGIIAKGFIVLNGEKDKNGKVSALSPYRIIHDDYKNRIENSTFKTKENKKGGRVIDVEWRNAEKGHREQASRRKMIKDFIGDFYEAWRSIEGLPVREKYSKEYLGKVHGSVGNSGNVFDFEHEKEKRAAK